MNETEADSLPLSATAFAWRFKALILATWLVPPIVGLSFLVFIDMFSLRQLGLILSTPLEPVFNIVSIGAAYLYFRWFAQPLVDYLRNPTRHDQQVAEQRMRTFPLHYWGVFLGYLLIAPSTVIISAELYAGYVAQPIDWFRIHLVALIVSIIVGLPIFFAILDLFGVALGPTVTRPQVTIKAKVFLIGALVPLLIDTTLVQYFWSRTGYFTIETFLIWLLLEVLAVLGSLMFVRSFGQSLRPMEGFLGRTPSQLDKDPDALRARSTDELGVLVSGYHRLLQALHAHKDILQATNRILRSNGEHDERLKDAINTIVTLCERTVGGDQVFLFTREPDDYLVCVAQSGLGYNPDGHFRISLTETSVAVWVFEQGETTAISDVRRDSRASTRLTDRFEAQSVLAAPLRAEGSVMGVLMTVTSRHHIHYTDEQRSLLEDFAHEAAVVLHTQTLQQQRHAAETEREAREARVRLLLNSTAEAIFGVDLEGKCIFVNPACLSMLGYEREEELLGQGMHELIHHTWPDGSPYPKDQCRVRLATLQGESVHSDQEVHWRKDGSAFPVEYWAHPIEENGEVIGAVVTFVDITERKEAEERLKRLSEHNRLLLESTSDGIFGLDKELRCTFANHAAANMLGYSREDLKGRDMHALVHHTHEDGTPMAREESFLYRAIQENRTFWSEDGVLWRSDGSSFPVQYSANPIQEHGEVIGAVVVFRNVAEARAMARKMDYLATHDPLTGLVNRREFERRLEVAVRAAREEHATHIVCYIDLDQFKVVNDTSGHVAGDELLRQLTSLLTNNVRDSDTLARLGGDEFGVLVERCPVDRGVALAHELRDTVQDFRFVWEGRTFAVGASVGVVPITEEVETVSSVLSAADAACYMAKDHGRNRIHLYEDNDAELARRRGEMHWVSHIRDALDEDRFELCYQSFAPIGEKEGDEGLYFEILVRMQDRDGTVYPPGAFLPAAERFDVMSAIDKRVVSSTFQWLEEHRSCVSDLGLCAINLSGQSLGDEKLLAFIAQELERRDLPATKICFEVTETAAVANLRSAVHFMRELREFGCHFALDDFGSGMSSFAYLKSLPVDYLKIDGNFVRDLVRDPMDRAMVKAISQVAHVMNISTVAEFVEDHTVLASLRELGVDYAQGYGIAKPRPIAEFDGARPTPDAGSESVG